MLYPFAHSRSQLRRMSRLAWPLWLVTAIVAAGQHDVPDFDSNFDAGGGIGSSHGELAAQQQEAFET